MNPLNFPVVLPAFIGFGIAIVERHRGASSPGGRSLAVLLFIQVAVVFAASLAFSAIGAKHLTILLPAWCGLIAIGLLSLRAKWLGWLCGLLILATTIASLFNYFTNRQFADADMVTPWREIAATVERSERPGEALIIGYHPDRGVYDIFRRYYHGKLKPQYLDFSDWRRATDAGTQKSQRRLDSPPRQRSMGGDRSIGRKSSVPPCFALTPFQMREHTLKRV